MKFGQLIEYNMRTQNNVEKLAQTLFWKIEIEYISIV